MNNLNSILIEGYLARDPLIRTTPKRSFACNLSLASNRYYRGEGGTEREVSFFDIEAWGKLAESCSNLGHKGSGVRAVGRLRQDRWQGLDGKSHARVVVVVVVEHVEFKPEFKKDDAHEEAHFEGYEAGAVPPEEEHEELTAVA